MEKNKFSLAEVIKIAEKIKKWERGEHRDISWGDDMAGDAVLAWCFFETSYKGKIEDVEIEVKSITNEKNRDSPVFYELSANSKSIELGYYKEHGGKIGSFFESLEKKRKEAEEHNTSSIIKSARKLLE